MPKMKDPNSRRSRTRSNGVSGVVRLPAEGYDGPFPDWPSSYPPSKVEAELWRDTWRLPQAAAWAEGDFTRVVCRYVALAALAEDIAGVTSAQLAELRQVEASLGLTPLAMKRLGWELDNQPEHLAVVPDPDRFAHL